MYAITHEHFTDNNIDDFIIKICNNLEEVGELLCVNHKIQMGISSIVLYKLTYSEEIMNNLQLDTKYFNKEIYVRIINMVEYVHYRRKNMNPLLHDMFLYHIRNHRINKILE